MMANGRADLRETGAANDQGLVGRFLCGLQTRLLLVVIGAVLVPLALPLLHTALGARRQQAMEVRSAALRLAQTIAREQSGRIAMVRPLLGALAEAPEVRAGDRPALRERHRNPLRQPGPAQVDAAGGHPAEGPYDRSGFGPGPSSPMPAGGDGGSPADPFGG